MTIKKTMTTADLPEGRRREREKILRQKAAAEKYQAMAWAEMKAADKDKLLKAALERLGLWNDPE